MTKTNVGRIVLGGIVAGIVLDILGYIVDGILLAPQWTAGMTALGKSGGFTMNQIVSLNLLGLANGIFAIWLYAAIRPRYGAGPKAAIVRRTGPVGRRSASAQRRDSWASTACSPPT